MLHNTLSALLVSLTSRYAKLSPSDVGIGIGGGRLVIDNVELRADTFNGPHLPFHVHQGRAGRLRVNVPWRALSSTPVQLYLENVHLIAGPKSSPESDAEDSTADNKQSSKSATSNASLCSKPPPPPILPIASTRDQPQVPWHQTNIGRLLFNVSVEIYGLKVEYRDDDCIGIMSVASLRAFSAGPDWSLRFVSFAPDLDHDRPDATAVSMRKSVRLAGVHIVMIPRIKDSADTLSSNTASVEAGNSDAPEDTAAESNGHVGSNNLENRLPRSDLDHPDRNLDLNSFESKSPILDGVSISLRVLLCTGATNLASAPDVLTPGMHGEVSVEIDDPTVKLTARQLIWLDNILKQALSVIPVEPSDNVHTKRRPRRTESNEVPDATPAVTFNIEKPSAIGQPDGGMKNAKSAAHGGNDSVNGEHQRHNLSQNNRRRKRASGFMSVWEAIVGENSDETVDDAAIALGLLDPNEDNTDDEIEDASDAIGTAGSKDDGKTAQRTGSGDRNVERKNTGEREENRCEDAEKQYARKMVATAAQSGGVTWEVRLRMTDTRAWDRVHQLEREMNETKTRLTNAEVRVSQANSVEVQAREALNRAESAERRADELVGRNAALIAELRELERLTGEAGRTKDAMIRQTQTALAKAESELRAFYEKGRDTGALASRADGESSNIGKSPVNENGSNVPTELPNFEGNDDEQSEQNEEVVIMHGDLDIEDEVGEGNDDTGSNTMSDESSARNSVIVHDSPERYEHHSEQSSLEAKEAWSNEASKHNSDGLEAYVPRTDRGERNDCSVKSEWSVGDERSVNAERSDDIEQDEIADGPEKPLTLLVNLEGQDTDVGIRQQKLRESEAEEIPLTDDRSSSGSGDADSHSTFAQTRKSGQVAFSENVQEMHLSNFERLQQKMGHEGLTLI